MRQKRNYFYKFISKTLKKCVYCQIYQMVVIRVAGFISFRCQPIDFSNGPIAISVSYSLQTCNRHLKKYIVNQISFIYFNFYLSLLRGYIH